MSSEFLSRAVPAAYRPIAVFSRHRIATARVDSRHECARQRNAVNARLRLPVLIGVVAIVALACAPEDNQPAFTGDISKGNPPAEELPLKRYAAMSTRGRLVA